VISYFVLEPNFTTLNSFFWVLHREQSWRSAAFAAWNNLYNV